MANLQFSTYEFTVRDDLSLSIDVSVPEKPQKDPVVLIHLHGGFLVIGEKATFPPHWLINACHTRGWVYATASYRLLPEAKGLDILSDTIEAVRWIHDNVSHRITLAGSSAGGYLALATAAHQMCPKLLGVLSIYGMLDPAGQRYIYPGTPLRGPVDNIEEKVREINEAITSGKSIDGYPFPADASTDKRFAWISTLHQAAIYPDILTRVPGLSSRIAERGVSEIPEDVRPLFPASFGLKVGLPPMVLLHGDADVLVGVYQSILVAKKLKALGVRVHLELAKGEGHGFDAKQYIDIDSETRGTNDSTIVDTLRKVICCLEDFVSQ